MALIHRDNYLDSLRRVPLFSGLDRKHLGEVAKLTTELAVAPGGVLTQEGQHGRELMILVEGQANVERAGKPLAVLGPGGFFGELSLLDGQPRNATVTATTACTLLVVEQRAFAALLETVPGLDRAIMAALCARLREAQDSPTQ